jgi:hypothetical protein
MLFGTARDFAKECMQRVDFLASGAPSFRGPHRLGDPWPRAAGLVQPHARNIHVDLLALAYAILLRAVQASQAEKVGPMGDVET